MKEDQKLIWLDLEMTGLNPDLNVILEMATVITDSQLNEVARGPELVISQSDVALQNMDEWVFNQHTQSGLIQRVHNSTISVKEAEQQTLAFLAQHCEPGAVPLCGNSVWQDKVFLRRYMPALNKFFHYRIVDVSTIKELIARWYPDVPEFKKKDAHRAQQDIYESIAELQFYRNKFFVS